MTTLVSRLLRTESALVWTVRAASTDAKDVKHFPLVVLGGGAGGCTMAARGCRLFGRENVAVVDPAKVLNLSLICC